MRTAGEVLEYIDSLVNAMLRRPKMYALSPEAFEEQLMTLDDLRGFLTSDAGINRPTESGYARYLCEQGYSVMTYTAAVRGQEPLTKEDIELFEKVSTFYRGYLAVSLAKRGSSGDA